MTRPRKGAADSFPPPLDEAAYHGILGEIVREIAPHTEADPVGILAVLLSGVGSALGRTVHALVGNKPHHARLNVMLVGDTRQGAKGSAQTAAEDVLQWVDPAWFAYRKVTGLSTGEGLIRAVRDERKEKEAIRDKGKVVVGYQEVIVDAGVDDKRLWVVQEEFSKVLRVMQRESNTLSDAIRESWDGKDLQVLTSGNPYRATAPHISIVAHITESDLEKHFSANDAENGFGNRFLWFKVRRQRYLPDGDSYDTSHLGRELAKYVEQARTISLPIRRDDEAREKWHRAYPQFGQDTKGMVAGLLSRGEAQTLRLSILYAALDLSPVVSLPHLMAALAVWDHCHNSVARIFGATTGDEVRDKIAALLRKGPKSTAEIANTFGRNLTQLSEMLEQLQDEGVIFGTEIPTGGRPRTMWELTRELDEEEAM